MRRRDRGLDVVLRAAWLGFEAWPFLTLGDLFLSVWKMQMTTSIVQGLDRMKLGREPKQCPEQSLAQFLHTLQSKNSPGARSAVAGRTGSRTKAVTAGPRPEEPAARPSLHQGVEGRRCFSSPVN